MSELKRNEDFARRGNATKVMTTTAGIDESQPWRTADMEQAMASWTGSAEAGFDPYNHVGAYARKPQAA
jgi:hypothetical protein